MIRAQLEQVGEQHGQHTRTLHRHTMNAIGVAVIVTLTALTHLDASANPKLYEEARQLIATMNAKQAYMLLLSEQEMLSGTPDFDYLLGVAALDSGKPDEAIIAFERVLAVQPRNAGAQLDLARAYFNVGSFDLAEATFRRLRAANPPASALTAIDKYLAAIAERRNSTRRLLSLWGETALGYDSNITGVPTDFSSAVQQSFNLVGITATGNSIKRKAPYLGAALGVDYITPISEKWSAYVGGDIRGRGYRRQGEFNSFAGDVRASAIWDGGVNQIRLNASYNQFAQKGDAPGEPKPTNDRRNALGGVDWRYNVSQTNQLSLGVNAGQTRFQKNRIEDFDSVIVTAGWATSFAGKGTPMLNFTSFYSIDDAKNKLADGVADKSKKVFGTRAYGQYNFNEKLAVYSALGYAQRKDDKSFARATTIEFGRDHLTDLTLGVNWRFQDRCAMRAQWLASHNNSNIAIYSYTRHELSSTIRCDFM